MLAAAEEAGASEWTFGWEALVALGTIGLALGTAWLAWTTRIVARATQAEVSATWRPVVLPAALSIGSERKPPGAYVHLSLRNVGAGPALGLTYFVEGARQGPPQSAGHPLAVGDEFVGYLDIDPDPSITELVVVLLYEDLAARQQTTRVLVAVKYSEEQLGTTVHPNRDSTISRIEVIPG